MLTAIVTPAIATGKVTFYDGVVVLGTSTVASGRALLTTSLLGSGAHSIKAYYDGGSIFPPSTSASIGLTVTALPAFGFLPNENAIGGQVLLIADFNGDGKRDVVVSSVGSINQISSGEGYVALGNGDGTFQTAQVFYKSSSGGLGDLNLATGDFNGDGRTDVALSDAGTKTINVFLGNGDGTFQAAISYAGSGVPGAIAVADFNGDGKLDIVIGNFDTSDISVLLGNGDGTFQPAVNYPTGANAATIAVGDFNEDGFADVAVVNQTQPAIKVLLGRGDGSFSAVKSYPAAQGQITTGDLNGDGHADLVIAGSNGGVFVFLGQGDGSFGASTAYSVPFRYYDAAPAIGDMNGDGKPDIVVAGDTPGVLFGNGDGTLQPLISLSIGTGFSVAIGDFNGDGRADIAVESGALLATGPIQLAFELQPLDTVVGLPQPFLAVWEEDGSGNLAVGYEEATVTLTSIPAAINTTVTTNQGHGDFEGLVFPVEGTYKLVASSPGLKPVMSNSFQVVPTTSAIVSGSVSVGDASLGKVSINVTGSSTATATTNAMGSYSIQLMAGGTYTLTASLPCYSFSAPVTVSNVHGNQMANFTAVSMVSIAGVANDAGFMPGGIISPGSWVAIFGTDLAPVGDSLSWDGRTGFINGKLPLSLDGTSVTVNGRAAAVSYIQPSQINIQAPDDTAIGPVRVVVTTAGGVSNSFVATYAAFAPGLFTAASPYLVALHTDYSHVTSLKPAQPGETILLWGTGFGPASPPVPAGIVFSGANPLANTVTVTIGGQAAVVDFAGVVGAGLVQLNVQVPPGVPDGDAAVVATVGAVSTQTSGNLISIHR